MPMEPSWVRCQNVDTNWIDADVTKQTYIHSAPILFVDPPLNRAVLFMNPLLNGAQCPV